MKNATELLLLLLWPAQLHLLNFHYCLSCLELSFICVCVCVYLFFVCTFDRAYFIIILWAVKFARKLKEIELTEIKQAFFFVQTSSGNCIIEVLV